MQNLKSHFLYPAALFSSKEPHIVNTILGSCVSVCLYDSTLNVGAINHYMLPFWNGNELASPKYGNIAIEKLVDQMYYMGVQKKNMVAKVFGGGEVIKVSTSFFNVGLRNIELAMEMLDKLNIKIIAKSVGGKNGRKIQFNTYDGSVKMKFVENSSNISIPKAVKIS